jgi:outer membrane receptor protein involved in Fe transport
MQQDQKLHGKITDSKGEPIIGANVIVKGSTNGTITDFDGMFNLSVPANAVIVIKYIGYKQQEISVKGRSTINVVLKEDNEILDEVVVVGYGTKQKKSLTASVETVSTKEMQSMPVGNASNAFAGRVPGLITVQNNGEIGADGTNIMIRGVGTTGNSNPLIVVDGVPRGSLNEIDINNVKSYTV